MKHRLLLAPLVVILISCGGFVGVTPARAAVPQFPTCVKTPLGNHTSKYFFDPGNLEDTPIRTVTVERVDLTRRRDGIWVGVAPQSGPIARNYAYFSYNHSKKDGYWAKCGLIKPPRR